MTHAKWYMYRVADQAPPHPIIRDEPLQQALDLAAPNLERGISAARAVHELGIVGALHVAAQREAGADRRRAGLDWLIAILTRAEPGIDWEALAGADADAWDAD